jgi:hypothetical protein
MNEADTRSSIMKLAGPSKKALVNRSIHRVKQNIKPRKIEKPHLAKHGLKGEHHRG